MSKPESPGSQSLEEILASIRKTLSEDRPDEGLSGLDAMEATGTDGPAPQLNGAHVGDSLHNRLVVGLEGLANGHGDEEEELGDLLASDLPAPQPAPKPNGNGVNGSHARDEPWFLAKRAGASDDAPKQPTAERAEAVPAPQPEEITLTRPETLRRSFPPLFGATESAPARSADIPVATRPADLAGLARVQDDAKPAPATVKPAAAPSQPADEAPKASPVQETPTRTDPLSEAAAAVAAARDLPVPDKPAVAAPEIAPAQVAKPVADSPAQADATGMQGQPLQEVIARLLEPVIQQWLDANLQRMVEAAIREEVARQVHGVREQRI